jgi:hypothetical protein
MSAPTFVARVARMSISVGTPKPWTFNACRTDQRRAERFGQAGGVSVGRGNAFLAECVEQPETSSIAAPSTSNHTLRGICDVGGHGRV